MQNIPHLLRYIYNTPVFIALIPAIAVISDYTFTILWSSGQAMLLQWEASPLVRFAVAHNIFVPYLLAIAGFYIVAAYAVLQALHPTKYYSIGVSLVLMVSLTHFLGGMSWLIRESWYSYTVIALSFLPVIVAVLLFGHCFTGQKLSAP